MACGRIQPAYNVPLETERELAQARLQTLCDTGLWSVRDFVGENPYRIFAAHECAGICDGSMATKMTVQVCGIPQLSALFGL